MNRNFLLSRKRRVVFTLVVLAMAAQVAFSQTSTTGAIRGTLTDSTGAVISGATVTITSKATDQVRTAKSDSSGQYAVGLLPPEIYTISITAAGFKTEQPAPVSVVVTETARVDAKMSLSAAIPRQ